jgi:hypothetical protein
LTDKWQRLTDGEKAPTYVAQEGVKAMLLTDLLAWLVQQGLENRYGPAMEVGLMFVGVGLRSRARSAEAWCVGGVLIVMACLAFR